MGSPPRHGEEPEQLAQVLAHDVRGPGAAHRCHDQSRGSRCRQARGGVLNADSPVRLDPGALMGAVEIALDEIASPLGLAEWASGGAVGHSPSA